MMSIGGRRALSLEPHACRLATPDLRSLPSEPCRSRLTKIDANYRRSASIQISQARDPVSLGSITTNTMPLTPAMTPPKAAAAKIIAPIETAKLPTARINLTTLRPNVVDAPSR